MLEISINKKLKDTLPQLAIGYVSAGVRVAKYSHELWQEINSYLALLTSTMTAEAIASLPQIAAIRAAYKALGKDPSRYRGSAEALLRRVLSGKALYQVNNVVDINNLVSLESFQPMGSYDLDRLSNALVVSSRIIALSESLVGLPKGPCSSAKTGRFSTVFFSFIGAAGVKPQMAEWRNCCAVTLLHKPVSGLWWSRENPSSVGSQGHCCPARFER